MSRSARLISIVVICAMACLIARGSASADEDLTSVARGLFESGRRHFDLSEYEAALEDFKSGYRLKDDPVFLYNIGLCHRLLNHKPEALRFFKSYLDRAPAAPNRALVERNIESLNDEIASETQARAQAQSEKMVTGPPPDSVGSAAQSQNATLTATVDAKPLKRRWWIWATVGGVVVAGVAIGLGVGLGTASSHTLFPKVQF
jgi:hypothetical protein